MNKFFLSLLFLCYTSIYADTAIPTVLVSISPHKFFVEKIAGNTVNVQLMVPAGSSAHTYEPTPKQMLSASLADIWFCLGESFEKRAVASLTSYCPKMGVVDLRKDVRMISADPSTSCSCCRADAEDLHIWLSAREAKVQSKTIADALSKRYPDYKEQYQEALLKFIEELDALDKKITALLAPLKQRTILVSHPAYAYFCRDYQLTQLSIEFEGKDPTPRQMTQVLNQARLEKIKRVFIQAQYTNKGARLFGKELQAEVITLDPYSENYITSMLEIAHQFSLN